MATKTWTVQVNIEEMGDDTVADATVSIDGTEVHGQGRSRRNPQDETVPRIGDELAAARALSELADELLSTAAGDIEARTHQPVRSLAL
ncbi:DUF1876 domain-containing protein [Nocardioides immobilis]|uniref:DUF1876 domain-containing protein n=1 Tax=Nocardioides immobilis TaxID=2049295 RepID=A0A417XTT1_9ACTN|nr:DUF1876 domain-containing protein [Nocardioides immobilis]RHW23859.1 DUF1876 domain-containing protein [Nocardioides immobilis]